MSSNFRTIYLYVVSMITLVMIIGGIVFAANNIASYFYPDSYVFFKEEYNENKYNSGYKYENDYDTEKENQIEMENYKNGKLKNAIVWGVVIAVGGAMYKYHWNIIKKERLK